MGKRGLRALAVRNVKNSHYTFDLLQQAGHGQLHFAAPVFNEFVIEVPHARAAWRQLKDRGVVAGVVLEEWYPELKDCLLLCTTELHTREEIKDLVRELSQENEVTQVA